MKMKACESYESIVLNVLNAGGKLTKRYLKVSTCSEKSPDFLSLQVQFDVTALKLDTLERSRRQKY